MNLSFLVSSLIAAHVTSFTPQPTKLVSSFLPAKLRVPLLGRFRKKVPVTQNPPIQVGEELPEDDLVRASDGEALSMKEIAGEGKSIFVGLPGAFTPVCTKEHLPGYIAKASDFEELGFTCIVAMTTNDRFVNNEWAQLLGAKDTEEKQSLVQLFSDGDGEVVKALGLADDMGFGIGERSKRFAMAVENGTVTHLVVDDGMDDCSATSASRMLELVTPVEEAVEELEWNEQKSAAVGVLVAVLLAAAATQYTDFQL